MPVVAGESELWSALRRGKRDLAVQVLLEIPVQDRQRLRSAVRAHEKLVMSLPIGAWARSGEWSGELRRDGDLNGSSPAVLRDDRGERSRSHPPGCADRRPARGAR